MQGDDRKKIVTNLTSGDVGIEGLSEQVINSEPVFFEDDDERQTGLEG